MQIRGKKPYEKAFFLWFTFFLANAQTPDEVRLEYTILPENDFVIQTSRYRSVLNVPIKTE